MGWGFRATEETGELGLGVCLVMGFVDDNR